MREREKHEEEMAKEKTYNGLEVSCPPFVLDTSYVSNTTFMSMGVGNGEIREGRAMREGKKQKRKKQALTMAIAISVV